VKQSKENNMPSALITGASSGIGLEIARILARDHDVVVAARSAEALAELATELGDNARAVIADLSEPAGAAKLAAGVPDVDVLVNCAGFGDFGHFAEESPEKIDQMIVLNVGSLTGLCRTYLPGMLQRGSGRVMNVASTAAFQPGPLVAVYYATKAYVLSFSEALAEETRGTGVTVTALCPGPTASGFQAGAAMEQSKLVHGKKLPSAASVAAFGVKAMQRGDVVAVPGFQNKMLAMSIRFSPRPVVRRLVRKMQEAK
jgi:short-subunit dehydrogenase